MKYNFLVLTLEIYLLNVKLFLIMKIRIPQVKYLDLGLGFNLNGSYVFFGEIGFPLKYIDENS